MSDDTFDNNNNNTINNKLVYDGIKNFKHIIFVALMASWFGLTSLIVGVVCMCLCYEPHNVFFHINTLIKTAFLEFKQFIILLQHFKNNYY